MYDRDQMADIFNLSGPQLEGIQLLALRFDNDPNLVFRNIEPLREASFGLFN
jgi:hypothetical protein